jgi:hypothetical protein
MISYQYALLAFAIIAFMRGHMARRNGLVYCVLLRLSNADRIAVIWPIISYNVRIALFAIRFAFLWPRHGNLSDMRIAIMQYCGLYGVQYGPIIMSKLYKTLCDAGTRLICC